ncbi:MAG: hypothetical protein ABSF52_19605 [Syntrophobacteraceae bacterium]|jgi:hypothetical protein
MVWQKPIKIIDLIRAGLLIPPLTITKDYYGVTYEAIIQEDGTVFFQGKTYNSLSIAGSIVRKSQVCTPKGRPYPSTNGWTFWKYYDSEKHKFELFNTMRKQYLKLKENM